MWILCLMGMIIPMPGDMFLSAQVIRRGTSELGTVYVTSVSGPKQYGLDRKQMQTYKADGYRSDKTAEQTQFFQVITIKDNTLSYVAYTALGDEYDRAIITKDFSTGKKFLKD